MNKVTEWAAANGKIPMRYYAQINGKSPMENYIAQRKEMVEQIKVREEAKNAVPQIDPKVLEKQVEKSLEKYFNKIIK